MRCRALAMEAPNATEFIIEPRLRIHVRILLRDKDKVMRIAIGVEPRFEVRKFWLVEGRGARSPRLTPHSTKVS